MIPIDEQITALRNLEGPIAKAAADNLERLKRIDAVQVPDEPEVFWIPIEDGTHPMVDLQDYDTLRDLLRRESADAKHYREKSDILSDAAFQSEERAEAAEAKLAAVEKQVLDYGGLWDLSECKSKLAAIERMGREPSDAMWEIGKFAAESDGSTVCTTFTAMFAKMMEELK